MAGKNPDHPPRKPTDSSSPTAIELALQKGNITPEIFAKNAKPNGAETPAVEVASVSAIDQQKENLETPPLSVTQMREMARPFFQEIDGEAWAALAHRPENLEFESLRQDWKSKYGDLAALYYKANDTHDEVTLRELEKEAKEIFSELNAKYSVLQERKTALMTKEEVAAAKRKEDNRKAAAVAHAAAAEGRVGEEDSKNASQLIDIENQISKEQGIHQDVVEPQIPKPIIVRHDERVPLSGKKGNGLIIDNEPPKNLPGTDKYYGEPIIENETALSPDEQTFSEEYPPSEETVAERWQKLRSVVKALVEKTGTNVTEKGAKKYEKLAAAGEKAHAAVSQAVGAVPTSADQTSAEQERDLQKLADEGNPITEELLATKKDFPRFENRLEDERALERLADEGNPLADPERAREILLNDKEAATLKKAEEHLGKRDGELDKKLTGFGAIWQKVKDKARGEYEDAKASWGVMRNSEKRKEAFGAAKNYLFNREETLGAKLNKFALDYQSLPMWKKAAIGTALAGVAALSTTAGAPFWFATGLTSVQRLVAARGLGLKTFRDYGGIELAPNESSVQADMDAHAAARSRNNWARVISASYAVGQLSLASLGITTAVAGAKYVLGDEWAQHAGDWAGKKITETIGRVLGHADKIPIDSSSVDALGNVIGSPPVPPSVSETLAASPSTVAPKIPTDGSVTFVRPNVVTEATVLPPDPVDALGDIPGANPVPTPETSAGTLTPPTPEIPPAETPSVSANVAPPVPEVSVDVASKGVEWTLKHGVLDSLKGTDLNALLLADPSLALEGSDLHNLLFAGGGTPQELDRAVHQIALGHKSDLFDADGKSLPIKAGTKIFFDEHGMLKLNPSPSGSLNHSDVIQAPDTAPATPPSGPSAKVEGGSDPISDRITAAEARNRELIAANRKALGLPPLQSEGITPLPNSPAVPASKEWIPGPGSPDAPYVGEVTSGLSPQPETFVPNRLTKLPTNVPLAPELSGNTANIPSSGAAASEALNLKVNAAGIPVDEAHAHLYADAQGRKIAFGGSLEERIQKATEWLAKDPSAVIYFDSTKSGFLGIFPRHEITRAFIDPVTKTLQMLNDSMDPSLKEGNLPSIDDLKQPL